MIPLMFSPHAAPIFIIGERAAALQRLNLVDEYDARDVHIFALTPDPELAQIAGRRLQARWPDRSDFDKLRPRLVFVADLGDGEASEFASMAHAVGAWVNVHDRTPLCDFHVPARLRRGSLQIAVATDGAVPALSRLVRDRISDLIGPQWAERVNALGAARTDLLAQGVRGGDLSRRLTDVIRSNGWLT